MLPDTIIFLKLSDNFQILSALRTEPVLLNRFRLTMWYNQVIEKSFCSRRSRLPLTWSLYPFGNHPFVGRKALPPTPINWLKDTKGVSPRKWIAALNLHWQFSLLVIIGCPIYPLVLSSPQYLELLYFDCSKFLTQR